ncbi:MAG: hypothetical protein ACOVQ2_07845 [Flavobacterium sp.]
MKSLLLSFFIIFILSCDQKSDDILLVNRNKEIQKNKEFFTILEKKWEFFQLDLDPIILDEFNKWQEWQNFSKELYFKPKYSLTAFKQKSKELNVKANLMISTIPDYINKQEISTRFIVLHLQIKNLEMYLNLENINQKKVLLSLDAINKELIIIEKMVNELALKSKIVKEAGEENIIRLKDTTRAIR